MCYTCRLLRCMGTIVTFVVISYSLQWNIRTIIDNLGYGTMDRVVDILSQFLWAGLEYHSDN